MLPKVRDVGVGILLAEDGGLAQQQQQQQPALFEPLLVSSTPRQPDGAVEGDSGDRCGGECRMAKAMAVVNTIPTGGRGSQSHGYTRCLPPARFVPKSDDDDGV